MLKFAVPLWLSLLPACLGLGVILWLVCARRVQRRLALFTGVRGASALLARQVAARKHRSLILVVTGLVALILALARPLGGLNAEAASRQGVNLLIAIDGSESMRTEDVPGANRFSFAQSGISSLLKQLNGDRGGLLMFGGQATIISPLTLDTVSLDLINRGLTGELVGKGGSSLAEVIRRSADYFHGRSGKSKVLILFTDGEETEGDAVLAAQQAHEKEGLIIFTIGVGSAQGGRIPLMQRNEQREWVRTGFVRDQAGEEVTSKMDPKLLALVAQVAGGTYADLTAAKGDLKELYDKNIVPLAGPLDPIQLKDYTDWFQLPLALALILLVLEFLGIGDRPVLGNPPVIPDDTLEKTGAAGSSGGSPVPPASVSLPLAVVLLGLALASPPTARATVAEAQSLLASGKPTEAFSLLQDTLLKSPNDPLAQYNYALGAYAAGKYDVAVGVFEKLTTAYDLRAANLSAFQLGNSDYRLGEAMRETNPEGTIAMWQKALKAYAKASGQPAAGNLAKTHGDLLGLLQTMASEQVAKGDSDARLSRDKGIPAWTTAVAYLDQALQLAPSEAEARVIGAAKAAALDKIFGAHLWLAEDKARRAELQKNQGLEGAIVLLKEALGEFDQALAIKPEDVRAKEGQARAAAELEPWQVELANLLHQQGEQAKALSLDDAIAAWQKAAGIYDEVLGKNPASAGALAGREINNRSLHDGHVAAGDRLQEDAADPSLAPPDRDKKLEDGLDHYKAALAIEPGNAVTKDKLMKLGYRLTGMFVTRGQAELEAGQKLSTGEKPLAAIPWLERSVQSFGNALTYDPVNEPAKTGKAAAEDLLRKLRSLETKKVLAHSKEIKNAEQLKDTGKLALKLIDYDTDKLASKKQQNYTLPENRPLKDW